MAALEYMESEPEKFAVDSYLLFTGGNHALQKRVFNSSLQSHFLPAPSSRVCLLRFSVIPWPISLLSPRGTTNNLIFFSVLFSASGPRQCHCTSQTSKFGTAQQGRCCSTIMIHNSAPPSSSHHLANSQVGFISPHFGHPEKRHLSYSCDLVHKTRASMTPCTGTCLSVLLIEAIFKIPLLVKRNSFLHQCQSHWTSHSF